jgi:hypothetical protein
MVYCHRGVSGPVTEVDDGRLSPLREGSLGTCVVLLCGTAFCVLVGSADMSPPGNSIAHDGGSIRGLNIPLQLMWALTGSTAHRESPLRTKCERLAGHEEGREALQTLTCHPMVANAMSDS